MLKRILGKIRLTPSVALSLLALFVALDSSGWAANGGAFILGVFNSATLRSAVVANINDSAFQVSNTSTGASAVPLLLTAAAGHPPMKVNTTNKVTNLNADYVDGLDSTAMTRVRHIPFTLASLTIGAPIILPANVPVHVMATDGSCVGQATVFSKIGQVAWSGAGSCFDASTPSGTANDAFHRIFMLDAAGGGIVETAGPSSIRVRNASGFTAAGSVTLMW